MLRWLHIAFLVELVAGAQSKFPVDTPPVEYTFSQPCDAVRPDTLAYFQRQAFSLTSDPSCTDCLTGSTKKLHDEEGHRLFSNRNVISKYTTDDLKYQRPGPLAQIVHTNLSTSANLRFIPEGSSCRIAVHFLYTWYGTELVLGFPVDGDRGHSYSNGILEAAYLHALQQQIDYPAVVRNTGPIHSLR